MGELRPRDHFFMEIRNEIRPLYVVYQLCLQRPLLRRFWGKNHEGRAGEVQEIYGLGCQDRPKTIAPFEVIYIDFTELVYLDKRRKAALAPLPRLTVANSECDPQPRRRFSLSLLTSAF